MADKTHLQFGDYRFLSRDSRINQPQYKKRFAYRVLENFSSPNWILIETWSLSSPKTNSVFPSTEEKKIFSRYKRPMFSWNSITYGEFPIGCKTKVDGKSSNWSMVPKEYLFSDLNLSATKVHARTLRSFCTLTLYYFRSEAKRYFQYWHSSIQDCLSRVASMHEL